MKDITPDVYKQRMFKMSYFLTIIGVLIIVAGLFVVYYHFIYAPSYVARQEALCSVNAKTWFTTYKQNQQRMFGSTILDTNLYDYQNHYNRKMGICFVNLSSTIYGQNQLFNDEDIYNIDENIDLASSMVTTDLSEKVNTDEEFQDLTRDSKGNSTSQIDQASDFYYQLTPDQFSDLVIKYMQI